MEVKNCVVFALCAVCLMAPCFSIVRAGGCKKGDNGKAILPPNLILSRQEKSLLEKVWRRSPTFRLQCERISQSRWLRVKIGFAQRTAATHQYRARTIMNRRSGIARIEIYILPNYVELIGHEFEHILEQLEGVNIPSLAAEDGDQARRHADGTFETSRALKAGRKVESEYIRAKSSNDQSDARCLTGTMTGVTGGGRL
jgi:hypothetical protein